MLIYTKVLVNQLWFDRYQLVFCRFFCVFFFGVWRSKFNSWCLCRIIPKESTEKHISICQTKKHDILVLMKCCKKARTYQLLNKLGTATEGIEMNHTFRFIPNSLCKLKKNVHTKFFLIKLFFTSRINQKRINSFI